MNYVITQTKQVGIDADTPEEAIEQVLKGAGDVLSINVGANPRPQPTVVFPPQPAPPPPAK